MGYHADMHIAVLFEYPTLQGGERSLLAALEELRRQQTPLEITAFAQDAGPLAEELRRIHVRIKRWETKQPDLAERLNQSQPDLIHANSVATGRILGRIAAELSAPTTSHLRDIIGLSAAAVADLNRHQKLLAVSQATSAFHVGQGIAAKKCDVVYNGVDLDEFSPRQKSGWLHGKLRLPVETPLIASIGQICLRKGWDTLGDAAIQFADTRPDVHLLLIGTRHSQKLETREYEDNIRNRFLVAGLEGRVHWLGERADVPRILNEIDLLVHSARQEPLGRVLLEASAAGVPIVATDVGGTREIIEHDVSGILVPPDDPAALAAAMAAMLGDPALAGRLRFAARRRAEERFGIAEAAVKLWNIWQSVAAS